MRTLVRHPACRAVVIIGVAWAVLILAVTMGLRIPLTEGVAGAGRSGGLDYSSHPGSLTPLSDAFIAGILGPAPRATIAQGVAAPRPGKGTVTTPAQRKVVGHDLTNDESENAYPIASIPFTARSDTRSASRGGDPDTCSSVGPTVWYRYTSPREMGLVAYTFGTDHAVSVGVFTRTGDAWNQVACGEDVEGNVLHTIPSTAGVTYYFQVGAPIGGGALRFSLDPQGTITRASESSIGEPASPATDTTYRTSMTPDGRYIAIQSFARNLTSGEPLCATGPPNGENYSGMLSVGPASCGQLHLRDLVTGVTSLISKSADGEAGNGWSRWASLSADARFAVFESDASNLGPDDPLGLDLFVKDLRSGMVELVAKSGPPGSADHMNPLLHQYWYPTITDDGRYVAFQTPSPLLPEIDRNQVWDVYVFDRATRTYELASVSTNEEPALPAAQHSAAQEEFTPSIDLTPYISPNGRFVVFRSPSPNLVENDFNGTWDTFLRDRVLGTTERVSVSSAEEGANGSSGPRRGHITTPMSADGRFVVFDSYATNLTDDRPTPGSPRVFVRDRHTGRTKLVQIAVGEVQGQQPHFPSMSRNGRYITYTNWGPSTAVGRCQHSPERLLEEYPPAKRCFGDVFVYDMHYDTTFPITFTPEFRTHGATGSTVSEDGSIVIFHSYYGDIGRHIYVYKAARPL